jgi:tetratricopeptide (TPR) repeat protein
MACRLSHSSTVRELLTRLELRQPIIREICLAWDSIHDEFFDEAEDRKYARAVAVKEGLFRDLVDVQLASETVDEFRMKSGLKPAVRSLRNHRAILQQWLQSLPHEPEPGEIPAGTFNPAANSERESKERGRPSFDRVAARANIERQKKSIVKALESRELALVNRYLKDLEKYQMEHGGADYLCMSLCDLAREAKRLFMFQLQLDWTERAAKLNSNDVMAGNQYADALLQLNRLPEALETYDQVIAEHPGDVVARNGRAEVLKTMKRLPDALAAYDAIIAEHPEDVVARNGRAEVLKTMKRLPDALAAYDAIIAEHPEDVVARAGRAEVLKTMNRLPDALMAYDAVIVEHPENVVARAGRAEVRKC